MKLKIKDKAYLYGKNSVYERLKANPKSISRIFVQDNFTAAHIINTANQNNIPITRVSEKEISKVKRADRLQGIVAEVSKFKYAEFNELLDKAQDQKISFVFLDNLNDPHNLGSILRILACFGKFAVVIPKHNSCEVNDTVMHVASGGENYISVCKVNNAIASLLKAKKKGFWAVGTVVKGGSDITRTKLPFPLCLVFGSEGKGIRHGINKHLDMSISLPMHGAKLSLNVAIACAIFCYEISKQR